MNRYIILIIIFYLNLYLFERKWHNLKLELEFSSFIKEAKSLNLTDKTIEFFTKNIFLNLKEFIYYTFKVNEEEVIDLSYYYNKSAYDLEPIYGSEIKGKDLVIKILSMNEESTTLAKATPAGFNIDTNRPNIGMIWINLHFLKNLENTEENYNKNLLTVIHETFHILGFNNIGVFQLEDNYSLVDNYFKIFSPKVLEYGKKQYGCSNLKSLFFENNFTPHWEDIQFGNEIELAVSKRNLKISEITLGFFEDLDWYKVNYNLSEILPFGLKKGCDFIKNPTPKFEEFSDKQGKVCSEDYTSLAIYYKTIVSNDLFIKNNIVYCGINNKNKSCLEIIKSDEIDTSCSESKCVFKDNKYIVQYNYNNSIFDCHKDEEIIEKNGTKIKCPKIKKFCEYKYECKNNCNGRGICLNGSCICNKKYKGFACEFENKKEINSLNLNKLCNFNGYFNVNKNKCECYDNYEGNKCEKIKIDLGSFGSNCQTSNYVKCSNNDYYNFTINYIEKETIKNLNPTTTNIRSRSFIIPTYGQINGDNLVDDDFKKETLNINNDKQKLNIFIKLFNYLENEFNIFLKKLNYILDKSKNKSIIKNLKNKIKKTKNRFTLFKNLKNYWLTKKNNSMFKNNKLIYFPIFNKLKINIKKLLKFIRKKAKKIKIKKFNLKKILKSFRKKFRKIKRRFKYLKNKGRKGKKSRKIKKWRKIKK